MAMKTTTGTKIEGTDWTASAFAVIAFPGIANHSRLSGKMNRQATEPDHRRRALGAFSLIELLTVIAIVGVLCAIIVPAVNYVRQSARESTSVSNLRQIATALNLYAAEHGGLYPISYFYQPGQGERNWVVLLAPYMEQKTASGESARNIFVSPLAEIPVRDGNYNAGYIPSTYSLHGLICPDSSGGAVPMRQSMILRPTEVILVGESTQRSNSTYANASFSNPAAFRRANSPESLDTPIPTNSDVDGVGGALRYRARGFAPVAFVDGHADLMEKGTVTYANVIADR